jgi:hypothetical protein
LEPEEKQLAKQIILKKLNREDYKKLMTIAKKYQLDEGIKQDDLLTGDANSNAESLVKIGDQRKYDNLVSGAKLELSNLQTSCSSKLKEIAEQYFAKKDSNLISKGNVELSKCDQKFELILSNLNSKLVANQYSNSIVDKFRSRYETEKLKELNKILITIDK